MQRLTCHSVHIKPYYFVARSPVFSNLSETLQGMQTIRAMGIQHEFVKEFDSCQDVHTAAWFLLISLQRWLAIRLDLICAAFVTTVAFGCVFAADSKSRQHYTALITFLSVRFPLISYMALSR